MTTVKPMEVAPSESVRVFMLCKKEAEAFHPCEHGCKVCVVNVAAANDCKQNKLRADILTKPHLHPLQRKSYWGQVSLDPKTSPLRSRQCAWRRGRQENPGSQENGSVMAQHLKCLDVCSPGMGKDCRWGWAHQGVRSCYQVRLPLCLDFMVTEGLEAWLFNPFKR